MTEREQMVTVALMELWNEIGVEECEKFKAEEREREQAISKIEQKNKEKEIRKEVEENANRNT